MRGVQGCENLGASFEVQNVVASFGWCCIQRWAKSGLGYLLLLMMRNDKVAHFEDQQGVGCTFLVDRLDLPARVFLT